MNLPALRNVAYPGDPTDQDLCALFTTEAGKRVLESWRERGIPVAFLCAEIDHAIARVRAHCRTGAPAPAEAYRQERRAWAQEIGWPWP